MTPRRPSRLRSRAPLRIAGLLVLLVAVGGGLALAVRPAGPAVPLDAGIPNGRLLIARGLSGVPGRGQPVAPITVDRVATDGAATYVRFHSTVPLGGSVDPFPQLYDDTGTLVNYGGAASYDDGVPWVTRLLSRAFPRLGSAGPTRGIATLGPLPPTAHAAVLRFMGGETVRVPLNLATLRRVPAYAGPLVQRAGLQLRVATARDTGLVLGYSPFGDARDVTLTDARGRVVPLQVVGGGGCSTSGFADTGTGLACRQAWAYPPQRQGARLTLTIRSFIAEPNAAVSNAVGVGPWHLPVVIP